ncbi:hypothetical protein HX109_10520 [Galbibacter sp. BG1]|uniref:hypothetical protein n=1 Tax=Galbibacter sp. BG1 TaxID=1170699 RepID=UPI0015BFF27F|nr:hypothetical protein [Galbibacter sp. BG1]QLE01968.1 hypothetical protein HX109_10520 [Galbibacter sp. BG1]
MISAFLSIKELANFQTDTVTKLRLATENGDVYINNIQKGTALIGASDTNSVDNFAFHFFQHFSKYKYSGIFYDHDSFKLTSLAYPLFDNQAMDLKVVSLDIIYNRVNPIAPRYLPLKRDIRKASHVFIKNIIFSQTHTSLKSTNLNWKAAESLLSGIIYYLKTYYPSSCTIPHVITLINNTNTEELVRVVGKDSEAGQLAQDFTSIYRNNKQAAEEICKFLKNYFNKISTERTFMVLSKDEVDLHVFSNESKEVISVVNNPLHETNYSPLLALVLNTSFKNKNEVRKPAFVYFKEAHCFYLYRIHRFFSKLRRKNVAIIYEVDEKFQNDLFYGNRVSDNILSRLSNKFIGRGVSQISARYSQKIVQRVKDKARRIANSKNFSLQRLWLHYKSDLSKILSSSFTRLKLGEFVSRLEEKDVITRFEDRTFDRIKPLPKKVYTSKEISENYQQIIDEIKEIKKVALN